jgi:hypothetical protein
MVLQEINATNNKIVTQEQLVSWNEQLKKEGKEFIPCLRLIGGGIEDINRKKVHNVEFTETKAEGCPWCGVLKPSCESVSSVTEDGCSPIYTSLAGKFDAHGLRCKECGKVFWSVLHSDNLANKNDGTNDNIYYKSFKNMNEFTWRKISTEVFDIDKYMEECRREAGISHD